MANGPPPSSVTTVAFDLCTIPAFVFTALNSHGLMLGHMAQLKLSSQRAARHQRTGYQVTKRIHAHPEAEGRLCRDPRLWAISNANVDLRYSVLGRRLCGIYCWLMPTS